MPLVSVIIPCYNEQATIRLLLDAIRQQTVCQQTVYKETSCGQKPDQEIEVIIADGRSTDHTREEVGQDFEVTRERIRQIQSRALTKLQNPRRSRILKEFA